MQIYLNYGFYVDLSGVSVCHDSQGVEHTDVIDTEWGIINNFSSRG